jgi:hypothetical protein
MSGFHLIRTVLGHDRFPAFQTKFGLYEYWVPLFEIPYAPGPCQRGINPILSSKLYIELVIDTKLHINDDDRVVVVAYIDDILIATKGSLDKNRRHVSKDFQLLMDNNMFLEIDRCVFNVYETTFLCFIVRGKALHMDL